VGVYKVCIVLTINWRLRLMSSLHTKGDWPLRFSRQKSDGMTHAYDDRVPATCSWSGESPIPVSRRRDDYHSPLISIDSYVRPVVEFRVFQPTSLTHPPLIVRHILAVAVFKS